MPYEQLPELDVVVQEVIGPVSRDEWVRMNAARARTNALRDGRDPESAVQEVMRNLPPLPDVQVAGQNQNGEQP